MTDSKVKMSFDVARILAWIETIFSTPIDRIHGIGRRALKNIILHNRQHHYLLRQAIHMCYKAKSPKALGSYFEVVTAILTEDVDPSIGFWSIACVGLYTLGNEHSDIRMRSARLLRTLEERQQRNSRLQDLDISISDKTIAVYKHAQYEISCRLANQHAQLAFHVFSEFSSYFKDLGADHKRNMVSAMLPWVQTLHLQLDPNGGPTAASYMVLVNLFEITVQCGHSLHGEVRSLWQALASGPHGGNVQLIMDFIISLCLDKKEQNFVDYAKQIVVFLSSTPAGVKVIEFLLLQISPNAMVVQDSPQPFKEPPDATALPYRADLADILPLGRNQVSLLKRKCDTLANRRQTGFSLCQLCLILLVDLVVSPVQLPKEQVPLLLQVCLALWDHHAPMVQDQAREMVVHLIHELVISKMDDAMLGPGKPAIENLIELIRQDDTKITWTYQECDGRGGVETENKIPDAMVFLIEELIDVFTVQYPNIREDWSRVTLQWATSCAVRHVACRSFQMFRCLLTAIDQSMLVDMLARLSNTVAHDEAEYLPFSTEILTTLLSVINAFGTDELLRFPQLFWAACACLGTIHEREFMICLTMLDKILSRLDLSSPRVVAILRESRPKNWEGQFEGLQSLVYKGLKSSISLDLSLKVLGKLSVLPPNEVLGSNSGFLYALLANLPRYLRSFTQAPVNSLTSVTSADTLAATAGAQGHDTLCRILRDFAQGRYRSEQDFLANMVSAVRMIYFPAQEYDSLVFLMGLLTNKLPWFKAKILQILSVILPRIDMRKAEISSQGPDLISPLLRLLQSEYCVQALQCLDHVLYMTGTPLDKHHLRMSMISSNSSAAVRKQFEKVQSLYGIPEETGWSIPTPAIHSANTRSNVHAVLHTCQSVGVSSGEDVPTPEIPFHKEEFNHGSYFPVTAGGTSTEDVLPPQPHETAEKLLAELTKLREIIIAVDPSKSPQPNTQIRQPFPQFGSNGETNENIYEQQTLPILHKSLASNASLATFQNGFTDFKNPTIRTDAVMTPTAFTSSPASASTLNTATILNSGLSFNLPPSRPGLGNRSITSPPTTHVRGGPPIGSSFSSLEPLSGDEATDEPFSDDDLQTLSRATTQSTTGSTQSIPATILTSSTATSTIYGGGGGMAGPPTSMATAPPPNGFLEKVGRPLASTKSGIRSGMRRLTGASGEHARREALRAAQMAYAGNGLGTPSLPTVHPAAYGGVTALAPGAVGFNALKSPKVPKVPDVWLQNPKSSDL